MTPRITHVIVDGPYPDQDQNGEEVPTWSVVCGHDDGIGEEELSAECCSTYESALDRGRVLAHEHRAELVVEAMPD